MNAWDLSGKQVTKKDRIFPLLQVMNDRITVRDNDTQTVVYIRSFTKTRTTITVTLNTKKKVEGHTHGKG